MDLSCILISPRKKKGQPFPPGLMLSDLQGLVLNGHPVTGIAIDQNKKGSPVLHADLALGGLNERAFTCTGDAPYGFDSFSGVTLFVDGYPDEDQILGEYLMENGCLLAVVGCSSEPKERISGKVICLYSQRGKMRLEVN